MSELQTMSSVDQLKQDNEELVKELKICHKLLEAFRTCLLEYNQSCGCDVNQRNGNKFEKLNKFFDHVNNRITIKLKNIDDQAIPQDKQQIEPEPREIQNSKPQDINNPFANEQTELVTQPINPTNVDDSSSGLENANNPKLFGLRERPNKNKNVCDNKTNNGNTKRLKKYICHYTECAKKFTDNYHLVRHIRSCHSLEKPYQCLKCDKTFAISERLAQHVKIYHKKDYITLKCSHTNCGFQTILEDRLKAHLVKHQTVRRFICHICHKLFLTEYELIRHKNKFHESREPITVEKEYSDQTSNAENGSIVNLLDQDFQTERPILSGNALKSRLKSRRHRNKIGLIEEFMCQEVGCEKRLASKHNLNKHMRTVHSELRPFQCEWPGCESAFKTRESMKCHLAGHRNERSHPCDVLGCDKRFNTKQEVHQHKRSHGIKRIDKYRCSWPACDVMCQSAQALTEHTNRHQNIRPFKCDDSQCDKSFFTAYELRQHVMKAHERSQSFRCDYNSCSMSFMNKRDLAKHRRLHQDVARFVCSWPECNRTFNTSRDVSDHMNKHIDLKANKCNFVGCDRSYFKLAHLRRHIKQCHVIS